MQESLLRCEVVPQLIAADQAESIILLSSDQAQIQLGSSSHLKTGSSSDASSRLVSFPSFLYFLELLSENVSSKGTISSDRSPLSAVLEAVTQGMWRRTVTHFMLHERTPSSRTSKIGEVVADEKKEGVLLDNGSMVSSASLLWLLRPLAGTRAGPAQMWHKSWADVGWVLGRCSCISPGQMWAGSCQMWLHKSWADVGWLGSCGHVRAAAG